MDKKTNLKKVTMNTIDSIQRPATGLIPSSTKSKTKKKTSNKSKSKKLKLNKSNSELATLNTKSGAQSSSNLTNLDKLTIVNSNDKSTIPKSGKSTKFNTISAVTEYESNQIYNMLDKQLHNNEELLSEQAKLVEKYEKLCKHIKNDESSLKYLEKESNSYLSNADYPAILDKKSNKINDSLAKIKNMGEDLENIKYIKEDNNNLKYKVELLMNH